ncbi:MAG TPA: DMT family protein [Candidatus Avidesulfovibrio excrementigallinarum]|nr:DMT family protein [Candidatus Avidesulfovibrio excrementigallinarum]
MSLQSLPVPVVTIGLLICSNVFMTFAWYGHLRFKALPLLVAVLVSWGIAFFEYMLQVPANRIGYGTFSAAELKAIQEIISLTVFAFFSTLFLGESLRWNHIAGFALIVAAAFLIFKKW